MIYYISHYLWFAYTYPFSEYLSLILISRCCLTSIGIPIFNIKQSHDCLTFVMEILMPRKAVFILKWGPTSGIHMMMSSNGNIFRVTGPLCGEFTGPGEFSAQRPVTRSFDVFFDLRLNKRLSKQPWGWWFETPAWSLWRHRNEFLTSSLQWHHMSTSQVAWLFIQQLV